MYGGNIVGNSVRTIPFELLGVKKRKLKNAYNDVAEFSGNKNEAATIVKAKSPPINIILTAIQDICLELIILSL